MSDGTFAAALQGLRARPLRTAITIASQVLAALALMVAIGGGAVTRSLARDSFDRQGGLPGTVAASLQGSTLTGDAARSLVNAASKLAPQGSAVEVSVTHQGSSVVAPSRQFSVAVVAVVANGSVLRRVMQSGRWLAPGDDDGAQPVAVLNRSASQRLVGQRFAALRITAEVGPQTFRVVGVVDDLADPTVYVSLGDPRAAPPELFNGSTPVDATLKVRTANQDVRRAATVATDAATRSLHLFEDPIVFRADGGPSVTKYVDRLETVAIVVAMVMLAVAILGVVNIGLATLRERADELCLRRALGASAADIFALVICEALWASVVAITVAGLLSVLVSWGLSSGTFIAIGASKPPYPLGSVILGGILAVLAGLAAAVVPAWRAARVPPATAMRG